MYDLIVHGHLVLEDKVIKGSVGVKDGKIVQVLESNQIKGGKKILDFGNNFIFPGFIDTHVHCFSNPEEGILKTSLSAATGGITTFLDMPYDSPEPVTNIDLFNHKVKLIKDESVVDIGLWATVSKNVEVKQINYLVKAGAMCFKLSTFETDSVRFPKINDTEILIAMEEFRKLNIRVAFHSENDNIIHSLIAKYQADNKVYPLAHLETRPPVTETSSTLKLLEFAYWKKAKLHIVHISHPRTIELIQLFKKQGVDVTTETCYPYLLLNSNDLEQLGPRAKNNPPLRELEVSQGLWQKVEKNEIDIITSDHAPWSYEEKKIGNKNIFNAKSGFPGLEIMIPLMFEKVNQGVLSPVELAKMMSYTPAKIFGIPRKGSIKVGNDADFTVINPNEVWTIDESKFHSNSQSITPFNNKSVKGKIKTTILRGSVIYDGDKVIGSPGFGQFIPGAAYEGDK